MWRGPEHDEASHPLGRGSLGLFGGREKRGGPLVVLVQGEKEETSKWVGARVRRRRQPRSKEVS